MTHPDDDTASAPHQASKDEDLAKETIVDLEPPADSADAAKGGQTTDEPNDYETGTM